ncbi:MAG: hypothetical protein H7288_12280 [Kineosporiaceae bacterium]|nr:hypothetical protein [Aeromicrobium sp.]
MADGRDLPFADGRLDWSIANATIEHAGDEYDQRKFISEQTRAARCWIITTPNHWFPVESHTSAVLRHWMPSWRANRSDFTRLLSLGEFKDMMPAVAQVKGKPWSATFTATCDSSAVN